MSVGTNGGDTIRQHGHMDRYGDAKHTIPRKRQVSSRSEPRTPSVMLDIFKDSVQRNLRLLVFFDI